MTTLRHIAEEAGAEAALSTFNDGDSEAVRSDWDALIAVVLDAIVTSEEFKERLEAVVADAIHCMGDNSRTPTRVVAAILNDLKAEA